MTNYEIGQKLLYREGTDLDLIVEVLENLSDKKTEAYKLGIRQIIKGDSSRFSKEIKVDAVFTCTRKTDSILRGLWELTEVD